VIKVALEKNAQNLKGQNPATEKALKTLEKAKLFALLYSGR
jgi:hypothetical protein